MKYPAENKCKICGGVFCCEKCRSRHEERMHHVELTNLSKMRNECAICNESPLVFHPANVSQDLLAHVVQKHLPLHCTKCFKTLVCEKDLLEGWKCFESNAMCKLESKMAIVISSPARVESPVTTFRQTNLMAVSTQTSPNLTQLGKSESEAIVTPTFHIQQSKQTYTLDEANIADSVSSLKNISSFSSSARIAAGLTSGGGAKLVRTTSTPMQQLITKSKEQHFDSSSGHVSSIHGSSSESDLLVNSTSQSSPSVKDNGKMRRTRGRGKMPVSATPLRQVMSKSIQRAIAEHGTINLRDNGVQPKKIFDSLNTSCSLASPLDLRTTPVLRRTQSDPVERSSTYDDFHTSKTSSRKQVISTSTCIVTEDVIVSSNSVYEKLETVYETCQSIESVVRSHSNAGSILRTSNTADIHMHHTPKASGGGLKKTISFDTAEFNECTGASYEDDEVFYTPKSISLQKSYTSPSLKLDSKGKIPSGISAENILLSPDRASAENEINDGKRSSKIKNRGRFWSLMASVLSLASFGGKGQIGTTLTYDKDVGVIKRCASFAGGLGTTTAKGNEPIDQQIKRKRTNTFDAYLKLSSDSDGGGKVLEGPTKRPKRIQGRRPIERMRKM